MKLLDRFSTSNKSLTGTLYLTATHLLFIDAHQKETWVRRACSALVTVVIVMDSHLVSSERVQKNAPVSRLTGNFSHVITSALLFK